MNLNSLNTFLAIHETGSLARAAEHLHIGQSTVTTRLQKLEDDIGQTLFKRHKSGVSLTASGYKFKRYAEAMTDLWRQARQETSLPDGIRNVCNLGCEMDLWREVGRTLVSKIDCEQPQTAISVMPGKHHELDQWLGTGLIDLALTYRPIPRENLTVHPLFKETLVLVSSNPDSPMRFDPGYIYVDAGQDFGRHHTVAYADAGVAKVSFTSTSWALDFLLDQGGSAYLPKKLVNSLCASERLYGISGAPTFSRNTYLVTNNAVSSSWPWFTDLVLWLQQS